MEINALSEGDGAFVSDVNAGDEFLVASIGSEEEAVVLDAYPNWIARAFHSMNSNACLCLYSIQ